jgi:hypothetical protein
MTEVMELKKSNLVLPKHFVELDREEMCYVTGGFNMSYLGAAMLDIVGLFTTIGTWLAGPASIFSKIAVAAWNAAVKIQALTGTWMGPGALAFAGTLAAGILIVVPMIPIISHFFSSAINNIKLAFAN